jgi:K+-transporting ATPase ATPase A chain
MLIFNAVLALLTYVLLRAQALLPLNPLGFAGVNENLAFNTAVSFTTNTNWQSYAGNRPCRTSRRCWR